MTVANVLAETKMRIREGGLDEPQVIDLLKLHLMAAHENSPPGTVFALDLAGLKRADVTFWAAWEGETLLGCGALRQLDAEHGEIKSMRTDPAHLGKGVGARVLERIMAVARERGYRRLSLETGSTPAFDAAHALYRKFGFSPSEAFGDYPTDNDFNRFMTRVL
jgi:putative acetyltransferase